MAARRLERSPEFDEQVTLLLSDGNSRRDTAAAMGMHEDTFRRWMTGDASFAALVKKAEGAALRECVGIIKRVARGGIVTKQVVTTTTTNGVTTVREETIVTEPQWTAAAWLLERRDPENWGRKDVLKLQLERILEDTREQAKKEGFTDAEAEEIVRETERMFKMAQKR